MNTKINNVKKALQNMQMKVVEVTETKEEFQVLLDNARETVLSTLNKIDKDEL